MAGPAEQQEQALAGGTWQQAVINGWMCVYELLLYVSGVRGVGSRCSLQILIVLPVAASKNCGVLRRGPRARRGESTDRTRDRRGGLGSAPSRVRTFPYALTAPWSVRWTWS
jgi:hypothetical protein|eukprot:3284564-Prymnesium_polylepis.2